MELLLINRHRDLHSSRFYNRHSLWLRHKNSFCCVESHRIGYTDWPSDFCCLSLVYFWLNWPVHDHCLLRDYKRWLVLNDLARWTLCFSLHYLSTRTGLSDHHHFLRSLCLPFNWFGHLLLDWLCIFDSHA